jgi:hypothetical protein
MLLDRSEWTNGGFSMEVVHQRSTDIKKNPRPCWADITAQKVPVIHSQVE